MAEVRPIDANSIHYTRVLAPKGLDMELAAKVSIESMPTLDYEPVRHGEWKYYHKKNRAVCTACSFERNLDDDFGRAISCPNCGARMEGWKNNG